MSHLHHYLPPAQLWLGPTDQLAPALLTYLYQQLAPADAKSDATLLQIAQLQHHSLLVVQPINGYTLELLTPVLEQLSFTLATNQQFFFVLPQADQLSPACANLLLKALEEPPAGYHFILLAQRFYQVLPTLRSRCHSQFFYAVNPVATPTPVQSQPHPSATAPATPTADKLSTPQLANQVSALPRTLINQFQQQLDPQSWEFNELTQELLQILTKQRTSSLEQFSQLISKLNLSDNASLALLDQVLLYWNQQYQQQLRQHYTVPVPIAHSAINHQSPAPLTQPLTLDQLAQVVEHLQQVLLYPPLRGNQKLCWREIYLQLQNKEPLN